MKARHVLIGGGILAAVAAIAYLKFRRSIPKGVKAISNFQKDKYLGKWYEIARIDYFFERNLSNTTAEYSLNSDGTIKVVNKGYDFKKHKAKQAEGEARFAGAETEAKLEVSFFKPFYSGYNVIAIDDDYRNALVAGRSFDYLWLLSRDKVMPQPVKENFLEMARSSGFDTTRLVWVNHDGK